MINTSNLVGAFKWNTSINVARNQNKVLDINGPDIIVGENRVREGSIDARFESTVEGFGDRRLTLSTPNGVEEIEADAAYVLVGYEPDAEMMRRCGIEIDEKTSEPSFDTDSCESNVPGLYVAGTLQAGSDLGRIFIENSREHADRIVEHVAGRLRP